MIARLIALKIFLVVIFAGCAKQPLTMPQSGAVQGGLSRVETGVTTAQSQQAEIARRNAEIRSDLQRVDNKDVFLDSYRKWKAQHP